jgi:hypothetical protein
MVWNVIARCERVIRKTGRCAHRDVIRRLDIPLGVKGGGEVHELQLPHFQDRDGRSQRALDLLIQPVLRRIRELLFAEQLCACSPHKWRTIVRHVRTHAIITDVCTSGFQTQAQIPPALVGAACCQFMIRLIWVCRLEHNIVQSAYSTYVGSHSTED